MRYRQLFSAIATSAVLAACNQDPSGPEASGSSGTGPADPITASAALGGITIVLDTRPDDPVHVSFETEGKKLRPFVLNDDTDPTLANSRTFSRLRPGTYTVKQEVVAGVTLAELTCVSNSNGGSGTNNNTIDRPNRTVTIQVEAGESVVCTYGVIVPWEDGDLVTYTQGRWGDVTSTAAALLASNYNAVYFSAFGVLEVGIPGAAGFSVSFTNAPAVQTFLPGLGTPGSLTADLVNPASTPAGTFGADVTALKLNVDFADAGITAGTTSIPFGDLTFCDLSSASTLNGTSVRDFLSLVNTLLGGGSNRYTITDLSTVINPLNFSFSEGSPSTFAQDHLVLGTCP